jgi:hypothetical protein
MADVSGTSFTAAAWAAWISAATLALLGVDYYALLGAFGGVLFTVAHQPSVKGLRLVVAVTIATFTSAVFGQGVAELASLKARAAIMIFSLVTGAGCQFIVRAAIDAAVARINALGGKRPDGGPQA